MDLLSVVDMAIIGSIMAVMEILKGFDKDHKIVRFYPLVLAVLGLVAALFKANPLTWQSFGYNAMLYVAVPSYIYKFGKTTILGK